MLVLILLILEFSTFFLEKMAGDVLRWTNDQRPAAGAAWEYQERSMAANVQLEQIVSEREEVRRELRSIEEFAVLPQHLEEGVNISLSKEHFLELYRLLPAVFARYLGTPADLTRYSLLNDWNRVSFIFMAGEIDLFFLNRSNTVFQRINLDQSYFLNLQRWRKTLPRGWEYNPAVSWTFMTPSDFLTAVKMAGIDDFPGNQELASRGGELLKFAVSDRNIGGMVDLAMKFSDGKAVMYPIDERTARLILEYLPDNISSQYEGEAP